MYKNIFISFILCINSICWGGNILICDEPGRQMDPRVASNGKNYFVVWLDGRNVGLDIYGRMIGVSGDFITNDFLIYTGGTNWYPRVAWNGEQYLVIWSREEQVIHGQFIDVDGNLTGSSFVIAGGSGLKRHLGIASNGENHLIVWTHCAGGEFDIYANLVNKHGDTLMSRFPICAVPDTQSYPKTTAINSKNYLVVWQDFRDGKYGVFGQKIASDGSVIGDNKIITNKSVQEQSPAIAVAGDTVIVVWEQDDGIGFIDYNLYCNILDTSLNVIYSDSVICAVSGFFGRDQRISAVTRSPTYCDKNRFLVSWHDYRASSSIASIYYTEVNSSGSCNNKNGTKISLLTTNEWKTDIAMVDWVATGGFLVVWENRVDANNSNIRGYSWECPLYVEEEIHRGSNTIYAFPNPFIGKTVINLNSGSSLDIKSLQIYDLSGRLIKSFNINMCLNQCQSVSWDGTDSKGRVVESGIYFARLSSKPENIIKIIKL